MEEFDLNKYRLENPMDYLKAIEFIKEDPHNDIITQTIYKITRLHIPDTVYKYYFLSNNSQENDIRFQTLLKKKVYMAHPKSFNDPFDNNAFYYRKEKLMEYPFLRRFNGSIIDDFSDFIRLSSFTYIGINCMPMWAHYSNNHQGFCVSYNTKLKENPLLSCTLFPVQYVEDRIDITAILESVIDEIEILKKKAKKTGEKIIFCNNLIIIWISFYYACLKHSSWSYEKELRCITASNSAGMPYLDATPSAIYLGAKCSEINKKCLSDVAYHLNIPIYIMAIDEYAAKYELSPKKYG